MKIKMCPICNTCFFDDSMTCEVCGYEFVNKEVDLSPVLVFTDFSISDCPDFVVLDNTGGLD